LQRAPHNVFHANPQELLQAQQLELARVMAAPLGLPEPFQTDNRANVEHRIGQKNWVVSSDRLAIPQWRSMRF
jgi:hypothetical protein